jgi:hypothetical protein
MWVIDQMVRALTGCPIIQKEGTDCNGKKYLYNSLGKSGEYCEFVQEHDEDLEEEETETGRLPLETGRLSQILVNSTKWSRGIAP